jgi:hypothetical protein
MTHGTSRSEIQDERTTDTGGVERGAKKSLVPDRRAEISLVRQAHCVATKSRGAGTRELLKEHDRGRWTRPRTG